LKNQSDPIHWPIPYWIGLVSLLLKVITRGGTIIMDFSLLLWQRQPVMANKNNKLHKNPSIK
jgi:hypothetical protein